MENVFEFRYLALKLLCLFCELKIGYLLKQFAYLYVLTLRLIACNLAVNIT